MKGASIMTRPATWKVLTLSAALTGLGVVGAGAAIADTGMARQAGPAMIATSTADVEASSAAANDSDVRLRMNKGAVSSHNQTSGSSQIYTAPHPNVNNGGVYGPFFNQNRGLGGAAAIGGGR